MPKLKSCGCQGRNPNKISISFWSTHCVSKIPIKGHCPSNFAYSWSWWASDTNTGASLCIWTPTATISTAALWCNGNPSSVYIYICIYIYISVYTHRVLFIHWRDRGTGSAILRAFEEIMLNFHKIRSRTLVALEVIGRILTSFSHIIVRPLVSLSPSENIVQPLFSLKGFFTILFLCFSLVLKADLLFFSDRTVFLWRNVVQLHQTFSRMYR